MIKLKKMEKVAKWHQFIQKLPKISVDFVDLSILYIMCIKLKKMAKMAKWHQFIQKLFKISVDFVDLSILQMIMHFVDSVDFIDFIDYFGGNNKNKFHCNIGKCILSGRREKWERKEREREDDGGEKSWKGKREREDDDIGDKFIFI